MDTRRHEESSRRRYWALTVGACVVAILHALLWRDCGPLDDDAILYRYGENLAHGAGLAFNPGERVEGFTAPPLVFFHALVAWCGGAHATASVALGIASCAAVVAFLAAAWRTIQPDARVPWPALVVAGMPAFAFHAVAGLGTTLAAACVAYWVLGEVRRGANGRVPRGCDVALGLVCLIRPELHLVVLCVAGTLAARGARMRVIATLALPVVWLVFRRAYFGAWLPNTYYAKNLPLGEDLGRGVAYLAHGLHGAFLPLLGIVAVSAWLRRRKSAPGEQLFAAALVVAAGAAALVGGDYLPFGRFLVPFLPVLLFASFSLTLSLPPHVAGRIRAAAAVIALAGLQVGQFARAEREASFDQLEHRWRAIGVALRTCAEPGSLLAVEAIGYIGFESKLPIIDMLGLVDPVIAHEMPHLEAEQKGHTKYDPAYVLQREPPYILLGNGLLDPDGRVSVFESSRGFLDRPRFRDEYQQASIEMPGTYPLVYWKRHEAPPFHAHEPRRK